MFPVDRARHLDGKLVYDRAPQKLEMTITLKRKVGILPVFIGARTVSISVDTMSECLRRLIRNQLGSARRGSNPLGVDTFLPFCTKRACSPKRKID